MQVHVVKPGETPALIAASYAGCPKCARDLIAANPHKASITHPNGYTTFTGLHEGEKLNLPRKWFTSEFDQRPKKYFEALPYPDGRTPSTLGDAAAGVLADYATYDAASAAVAALPALNDQAFSAAVAPAAALIDQSVKEADGSSNPAIAAYAAATHAATTWANQLNTGVAATRAGVQGALATALESAQLALQAIYGAQTTPTLPATPIAMPAPTSSGPTLPPSLVSAATAVAGAISSSVNYCAAIAQPGSPANAAMHAFKVSWNAANPLNPVPVDTGNYEQTTADVLTTVLGVPAPRACPPHAAPAPVQQAPATQEQITPPSSSGLSTGAVVSAVAVAAGVVGGAIYLATHPNAPSNPIKRFWSHA